MTTIGSLVEPEYDLIDPNPDIYNLFQEYDRIFFYGKLASVELKWSTRMTLCAGVCSYQTRAGYCSIRLSQPLLKFRPRKDLVETLLHEMIHAYLFITANNRDRDGHGPEFVSHMTRINAKAGTNITIYHSFHAEVNLHKQHWWRCDGPCKTRPPYYGMVKRSMNRAPGKNDFWFADHQSSCGGQFIKVKEPENYKKKGASGNAPVKGKGPSREPFHQKNSPDRTLGKFAPTGRTIVGFNGPLTKAHKDEIIPQSDYFAGPSTSGSTSMVPFSGSGNVLGGKKRVPPPVPTDKDFKRLAGNATATGNRKRKPKLPAHMNFAGMALPGPAPPPKKPKPTLDNALPEVPIRPPGNKTTRAPRTKSIPPPGPPAAAFQMRSDESISDYLARLKEQELPPSTTGGTGKGKGKGKGKQGVTDPTGPPSELLNEHNPPADTDPGNPVKVVGKKERNKKGNIVNTYSSRDVYRQCLELSDDDDDQGDKPLESVKPEEEKEEEDDDDDDRDKFTAVRKKVVKKVMSVKQPTVSPAELSAGSRSDNEHVPCPVCAQVIVSTNMNKHLDGHFSDKDHFSTGYADGDVAILDGINDVVDDDGEVKLEVSDRNEPGTDSIVIDDDEPGNASDIDQMPCPVCETMVPNSTLEAHVELHFQGDAQVEQSGPDVSLLTDRDELGTACAGSPTSVCSVCDAIVPNGIMEAHIEEHFQGHAQVADNGVDVSATDPDRIDTVGAGASRSGSTGNTQPCPVCQAQVPPAEIERHVNAHFEAPPHDIEEDGTSLVDEEIFEDTPTSARPTPSWVSKVPQSARSFREECPHCKRLIPRESMVTHKMACVKR